MFIDTWHHFQWVWGYFVQTSLEKISVQNSFAPHVLIKKWTHHFYRLRRIHTPQFKRKLYHSSCVCGSWIILDPSIKCKVSKASMKKTIKYSIFSWYFCFCLFNLFDNKIKINKACRQFKLIDHSYLEVQAIMSL